MLISQSRAPFRSYGPFLIVSSAERAHTPSANWKLCSCCGNHPNRQARRSENRALGGVRPLSAPVERIRLDILDAVTAPVAREDEVFRGNRRAPKVDRPSRWGGVAREGGRGEGGGHDDRPERAGEERLRAGDRAGDKVRIQVREGVVDGRGLDQVVVQPVGWRKRRASTAAQKVAACRRSLKESDRRGRSCAQAGGRLCGVSRHCVLLKFMQGAFRSGSASVTKGGPQSSQCSQRQATGERSRHSKPSARTAVRVVSFLGQL